MNESVSMEVKQEAGDTASTEGGQQDARQSSSSAQQYMHLNDELTQLEKALEVVRKGNNDDDKSVPVPVPSQESDRDVKSPQESNRGVKRKSPVDETKEEEEEKPDPSIAIDNFLVNTLAKRNVSIELVKPESSDEGKPPAKKKGRDKADTTERKSKKATKKKGNAKDKEAKEEKEGSDDDESKKASRKKVFERKNIRMLNSNLHLGSSNQLSSFPIDIVADDQLEPETLAAQKEEQERIRRLQDAQQRALLEKLNQAFHEATQSSAAMPAYDQVADVSIKPSTSNKSVSDVIMVESSDEDDKKKLLAQEPVVAKDSKNRVISLSSSDNESSSSSNTSDDESEDDDCIMVLSDEEGEGEGDDNVDADPNNSGSHTNDVFNQPDSEGRVMANVGHPPEEQDIFLAPQLSRAVKPHQIGGIRFLYDNVIESIQRFPSSSGFGCILAHSMGLGKTIQVISFVDVFLRHTTARTVLCVVPINTIQNWMTEFDMWLPSEGAVPQLLVDSNEIRPRNFRVFLLNENYKTTASRAKLVLEWQRGGGVLLLGYEMYRLLAMKKLSKVSMKKRKNKKKDELSSLETEHEDESMKLLDEMFLALVNPGPDLIICDEGHRIKNCSASTSAALKKILTKRRVVLTGYPLQNNLLEYWCMVDFVRPNYLGTRAEFCNMFERPIQNGQCIDSTMKDRQLMRYRAHVLHSLLEGFVQRRGHSVLRLTLPPKEEHVLLIRMTPIQRTLYREFTKDIRYRCGATNPLMFFAVCCKIWNHPDVLYNFIKVQKSQGVLDNDLDFDLAGSTTNPTCIDKMNGGKDEKNDLCTYNNSNQEGMLAPEENKPKYMNEVGMVPPVKERDTAINYEWAFPLLTNYKLGLLGNSHKMTVLFTIIEQSLMIGDKILIFSQSLLTLDLIEKFFMECTVPSPTGHTERWCKNRNYFRLDGKTSSQERERLIREFNNNPSVFLFLLSTRAGCLGINLVAANRIVVYDASWNPCHDAQAVCRSYRYGQRKPCYIYRLVTDNCLEKKVYDRQVNKQGMSDRVVDELNPESNFTSKEVNTLIHESEDDGPVIDLKPSVSKYKDTILQYICDNMSGCVSKEPFEHESLLIDRKELRLTKQEKKLAKQSYEQEKRGNLGYQKHTSYGYYQKNASGGSVFVRFPIQPGTKLPIVYATHGTSGARILPSQTTPIPMQPAGTIRATIPGQAKQFIVQRNSSSLLIRTLLQQGVMVRRVIPPNDFTVSVVSGNPTTITIPAGQEVLVLRTPKGVYLRLPDGRIVAVRLPADFMNWQTSNTTTITTATATNIATTTENSSANGKQQGTSWNQNTFGFVQPNLHCGGSIKVVQGKISSDSKSAQPEVIDLSDDESKDNPKAAQDATTSSPPSKPIPRAVLVAAPASHAKALSVTTSGGQSVAVVTVTRTQPTIGGATKRLLPAAPNRSVVGTNVGRAIMKTVPSRLTPMAMKIPTPTVSVAPSSHTISQPQITLTPASLPTLLASPVPAAQKQTIIPMLTASPTTLVSPTNNRATAAVQPSLSPKQVATNPTSPRAIPPVSVPMPATTVPQSLASMSRPVQLQPVQSNLPQRQLLPSMSITRPVPASAVPSLQQPLQQQQESIAQHQPQPPQPSLPEPEPLNERLSSDDSFPSSSSHSTTENDQNSFMYNPSMVDDHSQAMFPSPGNAPTLVHDRSIGMAHQNDQNATASDDYRHLEHQQMKQDQSPVVDQMPNYYDLQPYHHQHHRYPYHEPPPTSAFSYGHTGGYGYMPYGQQPAYSFPSTSQDATGMMQNYDYTDMQSAGMGYQPYSHVDQNLVTSKHNNNLMASNHLADQQYMSQGYPMSQNYSFHHQPYTLPPNMYNAP